MASMSITHFRCFVYGTHIYIDLPSQTGITGSSLLFGVGSSQPSIRVWINACGSSWSQILDLFRPSPLWWSNKCVCLFLLPFLPPVLSSHLLPSSSVLSEKTRRQKVQWESNTKELSNVSLFYFCCFSKRQRQGERVEGLHPHWAGSHTVLNGKSTLGDNEDGEQSIDCCVYQFQIASYALR